MLTAEDFDSNARALVAPGVTVQQQLSLLTEVKESIELVHTSEYSHFLEAYLGPFQSILQAVPPAKEQSPEHKLRNLTLEILNRLPNGEVLRPKAPEVMDFVHNAMCYDNEENALLCLRICFDLHRNYRPTLEGKIKRFLDWVKLIYGKVGQTYNYFFEMLPVQPAAIPPLEFTSSNQSFKVLAETPLQVMFLFNLYPRQLPTWAQALVPLMVNAVSLPGPDPGALPDKLRPAYVDLKNAQIKTLSFLTYLMRSPYSSLVRPHQEAVSSALVRGLQTCPDVVSMRKELLVATRHALTTSLRACFYNKLDILMDEAVLVGRGRLCQAELRPLAFSMLAELIHHVRQELTTPQLSRIVYIFSRNIHDDSLAVNVQCTSVRLLLNLVEIIYARRSQIPAAEQHRGLLAKALDAFISKLSVLRHSLPRLLGPVQEKRAAGKEAKTESTKVPPEALKPAPSERATAASEQATAASEPKETAEAEVEPVLEPSKPAGQPGAGLKPTDKESPSGNSGRERLILYTIEKSEQEKEVQDARSMLGVLVMGMKTLLYSLANYGNTTPMRPPTVPHALPPMTTMGLREEEIRLAARAIANGIPCLRLSTASLSRPLTERDINIYDNFADMFSVLNDPRDIVEMFALQMGFMFRSTMEDPRLLRVYLCLLNSTCQRHFGSVLLHFLIDEQFVALRRPESKEGQLTMKLFLLFLEALKKYPQQMEYVLHPLFPRLIQALVRQATEAGDKTGYVEVILQLFRTLATGNFENLYIIFGGAGPTPALLPSVLNLLCAILDGPNSLPFRDKIIEACLITPARLSEQLAGLPKLMKPLMLAMEGKAELVELALRTLEYWVDSLNPEFLEPAMSCVSDRLLAALASHLRLPPYAFGAKALQLLGKLGGRNRKGKELPTLDYKENTEHGLRMVLTFHPATSFLVPLDRILQMCRQVLDNQLAGQEHIEHRREALQLMHICASSVLNLRSPLESSLPGRSVDKFTAMLFGSEAPPRVEGSGITSEVGVKTRMQLLSERLVLKSLLAGVIAAAGDPDLAEQAESYVTGLSRHFSFIYAAGTGNARGASGRLQKGQSLKELDPHVYLEALVEVLADEDKKRSGAALKSMKVFVSVLLEVSHAQRRLHTARLAAVVDGDAAEVLAGGSPQPSGLSPGGAKEPSPPEGPVKTEAGNAKDSPGAAKGTSSSVKVSAGGKEGAFPAVLDDLMGRLIHCCYGETWAMKFGGASAMLILGGKLPIGQLLSKLASCTKALLAVLRGLPKHAVAERKQIKDSLEFLIRRCLIRSPLSKVQQKLAQLEVMPEALPAKVKAEATSGADIATADLAALNVKEEDTADSSKTQRQDGDTQMEDVRESDPQKSQPKEAATEAPAKSTARRPAIRPAAEERAINNVSHVVALEIFNPRASEELRAAADDVLKLVSEATKKSTASLLTGVIDKLQPQLDKRRLLPLRHVPQQTGYAAGLTYCLQQDPPLLSLTLEVVNLIRDAYMVCEQDSALLVQTMTSSARQPAMDALPAMRAQCLSLVCAAMSWPDFRSTPSPLPSPSEKSENDTPEAKESKEAPPKEGKSPPSTPSSGYKDNGELGQLRNQIIQMLFRQLTNPDKIAVKQAQEGLGAVIAHQKMPKTLLQTSLRPILVNLAYYNKLKLPLLQGLARLLQLLASWFNVTLGEKLIDHLKKWLEPEKMQQVSKSWDSGQDAEIAAAILELFHLLPSQAAKFLETSQERPGLVVLTIELEKALSQTAQNMQPTKMWSPYREPLTKYLNKYSAEAVSYFLDATRMATANYFWHFLDIIRSPLGRPLLDKLAASPEKILALLTAKPIQNPQVQQMQTEAQFNALHLLAAMVKLLPDWLPKEVFEVLHRRWKAPERRSRVDDEENLARLQLLEGKRVAKCMLNYISRHKDQVGPLFDLLDIFTVRTRVNFTFLREFLMTTLAATYTVEERQAVLTHFLNAYANVKEPKYSQDQLVAAAKLLILPMLEASFKKGEQIVNDEILGSMVKHIFDAPDELAGAYGDNMNIEMLRLASLFIKEATEQLVNNRKELIRFGWNHLKKDDSAAKYYAFLNVCHFLEAYQAPEKIVLQVFVALLRTYQPDSRKALVRQALDVLTPALVRRLTNGDSKKPTWVRYVRKVLMEEGHSMAHMVHIWQLLVRHADLFYTSRAQFVSQMVNSLMKLGLPQGATLENRRLAIDLAALVVQWEKQRIEGPPDAARKRSRDEAELKDDDEQLSKQMRLDTPEPAEAADPAAAPIEGEAMLLSDAQPSRPPSAGPGPRTPGDDADEFKPPAQMQEIIISFLTRMAFLLGDATKEPEFMVMHKHTLSVLKDALSLWPNAPVKLHYIEKLITSNLQQNVDPPPAVVTGLQVVDKVLSVHPQAFVESSSEQINLLVDACFKVKHQPVITDLCSTLKTIYTLFPPDEPENPAKAIQDKLHRSIIEALHSAGTAPHLLAPNAPLLGVCTALSVMKTLDEVSPGFILNSFVQHMVRLLGRIARENSGNAGLLLAAKTPIPQRGAQRDIPMEPEYGSNAWAVSEIIPLIRPLVNNLGEQKRGYLQCLLLLTNGPAAAVMEPSVLMGILSSLRTWILDPNFAQAALQDKDALVFLQRCAKLHHESRVLHSMRARFEMSLLELIYTICTTPGPYSPQFQKETFDRVERPFMLGLRSSSQEMRKKFLKVYNDTLPATLFDRLKFILCTQNWETLSSTFWLKQALDMLMSVLTGDEPIKLAPNSAQIPVLLSRTKQNVFNVREQHEAQQAAAAAAATAGLPPPATAAQSAVLPSIPSTGMIPQQRPVMPMMQHHPRRQLQYGGAQPSFLQQPGLQQGPGFQQAPGGQPLQQPGLPHQQSQQGIQQQQAVVGQQQPGISHPQGMQSMPQQPGSVRPQQMMQPGMLPQQASMQHMYGRMPQSMTQAGPGQPGLAGIYPTSQPGMMQFQRPGMLQPQQPVFPQQQHQQVPGLRPAVAMQSQPMVQQSVAQQLRSQQPITSHSMPMQPGQPVMSQPQFMAGAAQMASRPPGMLMSGAMPFQPRPQQQGQQMPQSASPLVPAAQALLPGFTAPGLHPTLPSRAGSPAVQTGMHPTSQAGMSAPSQNPMQPQQVPQPLQNQQADGTSATPMQGVQQATPQSPAVHPQVAALQRMGSLQRASSGTPLQPSLHRAPSSQTLLTQPFASQASQGLLGIKQEEGAAPKQAGPDTEDAPDSKDDGLGEREVFKDLELPEHIDAMMQEHAAFLVSQGGYKVEQLISSISEVTWLDNLMGYHLWVLIFPIAWATLSDDKSKQIQLAKPIISLLSREFHQDQANERPNVVQVLLEGISLSQPQPKIPSELIKFLGKTYNAWHIAIPLLESHVMLFPQETRCFDALAELYHSLNEEDVLFGLWKKRCAVPETRAALAWLQHGCVDVAQEALTEAMQKHASRSSDPETQARPGKSEAAMWQRQYAKCCAELSQWDVVQEYGKQTENYSILASALAKTQDWRGLKEDILPYAMLEETAETHMIQAYVHLQEGAVAEGNTCIIQAINKALERRWLLPEIGVWPQLPLLAQFQQIVELQESTRLLLDLGASGQRPDHNYRDLKDIMETWRLRTPNEWERFSTWSDVLIWRNQIYNIVINAFKTYAEVAPQLYQLGYRDKAWNVNRLGCIARKHGSPETAKYVINHLYGYNAMEVQEAFTKIKEQAKSYLLQPELLANGLQLVNGQNLDYFQPHHQAELFRLKGIFLQEMNQPSDANAAFSTSLTLCTQLPDGWLSWGAFCDGQFKATKDAGWLESAVTAYLQAARQGSTAARGLLPRVLNLLSFDNESGVVGRAMERSSRQVPHWVWLAWLPQLLTSLQRPEAPYTKRILIDLARIFPQALYYSLRTYLLMMREAAHKAVSERRAANPPAAAAATAPSTATPLAPATATPLAAGNASVIPMSAVATISSASAPSAQTTQAAPDATSQPQSLEGQPEGETSGGANAAAAPASQQPPKVPQPMQQPAQQAAQQAAQQPAQQPPQQQQGGGAAQPAQKQDKPPELLAFEAGREVMEILRSAHTHVCSVLEIMCTDIGQKFVAKPEERLLGVVHALLHRAYKLPFSNAAEVPLSLKKELAGVCRVCFSDDNASKHGRIVAQYREQFLRDLNPDPNPNFPATLGDLAARLKAWRNTLQQTVEETMEPVLRLEEESRSLVDTSFQDIEMPGQYACGDEVAPDGVVHIEHIGSDVTIIRRHGLSFRRLAFHGSNGKTRHFVVQSGQQWTSGDERLMQLLRTLNRLLDKHPESRQRHLAWSAPTVVPVWPQVRLIEEDPSYCSYGEAYEINCARYGRESDLPIVRFKQMCCTETGQLLSDPQGQRREAAFQDIAKFHVTENIFSQFMYKMLPTCNHLWTFKKSFCTQLALSGLLSHLLLVGGRSPNKLLFAKNSGKLYQMEFYPMYDSHGMLERNEPVPFRLTRNLYTFFTPFGVEGVFISSLAVAAQALLGRNSNLQDVLSLFLRDDILSWTARRSGRPSSAGMVLSNAHLAEMVRLNVERAADRVRQIAPSQPTDGGYAIDPQRGAHDLVASALDSRNLCKMDPTWQPWF